MTTFLYAGEVEWYLTAGMSMFLRSTAGPIQDRLVLYSVDHGRARGEITAYPTAECREQTRDEPNRRKLERMGRVSRRLKYVGERNPAAKLALELFHGDTGARFANLDKGPGRIGAVYKLVPAGAKVIAKSKQRTAGADLVLSDEKRIENECARGGPEVGAMRQARAEAEELYAQAVALYHEAARGSQ